MMDNDYVLLAEKEEMWAKMLMEVLEDNGIRCASLPVKGIGLSMRVGVQDCLRVFVPAEDLPQASELLQQLFSSESIFE
jgi:hypothetical protein